MDFRKVHTGHYLQKVEPKDYNVVIDGKKFFFDQPVKSDIRTYDNIRKLQQVKDMITQLLICWIIIISINTLNNGHRFK